MPLPASSASSRFPFTLNMVLWIGLTASVSALAQTPEIKAKVAFTDSAAAGLAGTKRVAITNVMVSFQASTGGDVTNTSGLFAAKTSTSATLQMPDMDPKLLAEITDSIHQQLKADLQAHGFELVPEAMVLASPGYQKVIKLAGFTNFSKFGNLYGDTILVGASGLKPYLPYNMETGKFSTEIKTMIKGWISAWGQKSSTEGGPSNIKTGEIYELPGLEVALAKELNANLVKATYVVTLGSTKAGVERFSVIGHNEHAGNAFAQVGLLAGQSRIAFRTPSAKPKGESARGSYASNFGKSASPAKDGDVVVTLAEPLLGGTDFFSVVEPETKKPTGLSRLLGGSGGTGADAQFIYQATLKDPEAYRDEVISMVKVAQRGLLELVKQ